MAELTITKENFEKEVLQADLPVLLDFWATWCGPCRMLAPTLEELAQEYDGRAIIGKINVDEQEELAVQFRIASIPTLVLMKKGQVVSTMVGLRPKSDLENLLNQ